MGKRAENTLAEALARKDDEVRSMFDSVAVLVDQAEAIIGLYCETHQSADDYGALSAARDLLTQAGDIAASMPPISVQRTAPAQEG